MKSLLLAAILVCLASSQALAYGSLSVSPWGVSVSVGNPAPPAPVYVAPAPVYVAPPPPPPPVYVAPGYYYAPPPGQVYRYKHHPHRYYGW